MLITFLESATSDQIHSTLNQINKTIGKVQHLQNGNDKTYLILPSNGYEISDINALPGIQSVKHVDISYKLASRQVKPTDTSIKIGNEVIGSKNFTIIAGPCSVENEKQIFDIAEFLIDQNVKFLRGGAFKPRTSPYSFQGLGIDGLKLLSKVSKQTGIKIVSEAMDIVTIDEVAEHVDVIQIGSRSMQNFPLLKKAGQIDKPVLLKRGFSAKIEEFLLSAEYILSEGNSNVILCERGVRSFADHARNLLDIAAIPVIKKLSHLPIIVDPSHASGNRNLVTPLSKAALVAGADGLLVEIHPHPESALSDGNQSLSFAEFEHLKSEIMLLNDAINPKVQE